MRDMHDPALLIIVVYALGGVAVIEAAALVFVWAALTRSRREAAELRQRVDPRTWLWTGGREAVKTASIPRTFTPLPAPTPEGGQAWRGLIARSRTTPWGFVWSSPDQRDELLAAEGIGLCAVEAYCPQNFKY
jgi:hypothetical protein